MVQNSNHNRNIFISYLFILIIFISNNLIANNTNSLDINNIKKNKDPKIATELSRRDPTDLDLGRRLSAVGTGPYFGIGSSYDGSDLMILQPNINRDLNILLQNQRIGEYTGERYGPKYPYLQLSGYFEAQTNFETNNRNSIDLTSSNLDFSAWINRWITAYTNFGVMTDETDRGSFRLIMGFLTFGNLNIIPVYVSAGQMFVPFGSYSTGTSFIGTLPRGVGRQLQQAISVGYYPGNGFHLAGAVYNGQTQQSKHDNVDQYAGQAVYTRKFNFLNLPSKFKGGVSYTNNIMDAAATRNQFASHANIEKYVPGYDVFTHLTVGPIVIRFEQTAAVTNVDPLVLKQGGNNVKPESFLTELEYDFDLMRKPIGIVAHYSNGKESAISSPIKYQYGLNCSVYILRDTVVSLEYSHRTSYSKNSRLSTTKTAGSVLNNAPTGGALGTYNNRINGRTTNTVVATVSVFY